MHTILALSVGLGCLGQLAAVSQASTISIPDDVHTERYSIPKAQVATIWDGENPVTDPTMYLPHASSTSSPNAWLCASASEDVPVEFHEAPEQTSPVGHTTDVMSPQSTYYVDAVNGDDANDGSSPSTAFASIAKINSLTLTGGQTVAFKAGDEWHEQLNISNSGTAGAPITYTAYGNGAQPILSAADTVTGWTQGAGASSQETCTYPNLCSGFEVPGFADWGSFTNNHDATISISTAQHDHGLFSMALNSTDGVDTRAWVTEHLPSPTPNSTVAFRWFFLAPSGSMKANNSIKPLYLASGGTQVAFATLTTDASGNPSTISFYDDQHRLSLVNPTPLTGYLPGEWNDIEIDITNSATSGGGTLFLNGNQLSQINTLNTSAETDIDTVQLGNVAFGGAIAPGGTIYFDDFKVSVAGQIGTYNGGTVSSVWSHPQTTDPRLINFNGRAGTPKASAGAISGPDQFSWNGTVLYVFSLSDPTGVVEIPSRPYAVASTSGASYISVSGLELRGAQGSDLFCSNVCHDWSISSNTLNDSYAAALSIQVNGHTSVAGLSIVNNKIKGSGAGGVQINNGVGNIDISGNEIWDFAKMYNPAYGTQNVDADGIETYSEDAQQGTGTITNNSIHDGGISSDQNYGGGIHVDTVAGFDIEHNTIQNLNASGIQLEKGSGSIARYNLIVNAGTHQYDAGLQIRAGEGVSISNQLAEYNTIYGGWWACNLGVTQDGSPVTATNIIIQKNICVGATSGTQLYAGDPGANGPGNRFLDNSFGIASDVFLIFNAQLLSSYPSFDDAVGYFTGSIQGDPQFVDPSGGDYHLMLTSPALTIGCFPLI